MKHAWYSQLKGLAGQAAKYAMQGQVPAQINDGNHLATFAGGCFWGIELRFQRLPGVTQTAVGYTQGSKGYDTPSYSEVCSGETGHTEAVLVSYDPKQTSYTKLLDMFWSNINPLQVDAQGNDHGTQYRTGIYTHTDEQYQSAVASRDQVAKKYSAPIATEVKPATVFYPAEEYHQQYLEKGGRSGRSQSAEKGCQDPIRCYG